MCDKLTQRIGVVGINTHDVAMCVGVKETNGDGCIVQSGNQLQLCDLKQSPFIVLNPQKYPEEYRKLLDPILDDRSPIDVYFCDAVKAAITLAQAGYGVAMLPDFFQGRQPSLHYFLIAVNRLFDAQNKKRVSRLAKP